MKGPDKTGILFMIGIPSDTLDAETCSLLSEIRPGSIILFRRNIKNRLQLEKLIKGIEALLGYKPLMAADQEGGIVTRLTEGFSVSPGAMALGQQKDTETTFTTARIMAEEMRDSGIDWNLAPVVDINRQPDNPVIGIRSFSGDPEKVLEHSEAYIRGMESEGILTCLKHFPGAGKLSADPHLNRPVLDISASEMEEELLPFRKLRSPAWMPTHILMPSIQQDPEPVTFSKDILTGLARETLGFRGVLLADDLIMGGATGDRSAGRAVEDSFRAGMDMVSVCSNIAAQLESFRRLKNLIESEGELSERAVESAGRINTLFSLRDSSRNSASPGSKPDFEENTRIMNRISLESVKVVKNEDSVIPVKTNTDNIFTSSFERLVLVEDSESAVPEAVIRAGLITGCRPRVIPGNPDTGTSNEIISIAEGRRNIIFTENAHLSAGFSMLIQKMADVSESLILVAMRNPYDADIPGIRNAVCSFGYNKWQQKGILDILFPDKEKKI